MLKSIRTGKAFTLAEVLITLGIIGVVAAMTMPTLMNSTNGAQYKTAYKKALSVLSQAVVMNVALDDYDFSQASVTGSAADSQSLYNIFKNRMNVIKTATGNNTSHPILNADKLGTAGSCSGGTGGNDETSCKDGGGTWTAGTSNFSALHSNGKMGASNTVTLFFNDGITFTFDTSNFNCTDGTASDTTSKHCYGLIDVNGEKSPNKVVECDSGSTTTSDDNCVVSNPTDIYPVVFYDQTILPASPAASAVLYGK